MGPGRAKLTDFAAFDHSGAGHGLFYYHLDIGRAVRGCWHEAVLATAPDWLGAQELLKARWLCASGVYHSAGNTLSIAAFRAVIAAEITAQEFLCKYHDDVWGPDDHYFARCNAGLGVEETEFKLSQVVRGDCDVHFLDAATGEAKVPDEWEQKQIRLPTIQQRSCNPAAYFGQANEACPAAFMAHFPCKRGAPDWEQCNSKHHEQCQNDEMMRTTFLCGQLPPRKHHGKLVVNHVLDGQADGVGLWGGSCTCPDGAVYLVGDNADMCGSLACVGGVAGECNEWFSYEWAYRKVVCAAADDSLRVKRVAAIEAAAAEKVAAKAAAEEAAAAEAAAAEAAAVEAEAAAERAAQEEAERVAREVAAEEAAADEAAEEESAEAAEAEAEAAEAAREAELAELKQEVAVAQAEAEEAAADAEAARAEAAAAAAQARAEARAAAQRGAAERAQMAAAAAAAAEKAAVEAAVAERAAAEATPDVSEMLRQSARDVASTASVVAAAVSAVKSSPTAASVVASVGSRTKATIASVSAALPPDSPASKLVSQAAEWPLLVAAVAAGVGLLLLCCVCVYCLSCGSGGKKSRAKRRRQERVFERRGLVGTRAVFEDEFGDV